jgi:hypothetical protein
MLLGNKPVPHLFAAQVAVRFPGFFCDDEFNPSPYWSNAWHIDGLENVSGWLHLRLSFLIDFFVVLGKD